MDVFKLLENVGEVVKVHTPQMSAKALIKIPFQRGWRNTVIAQWHLPVLAKVEDEFQPL